MKVIWNAKASLDLLDRNSDSSYRSDYINSEDFNENSDLGNFKYLLWNIFLGMQSFHG